MHLAIWVLKNITFSKFIKRWKLSFLKKRTSRVELDLVWFAAKSAMIIFSNNWSCLLLTKMWKYFAISLLQILPCLFVLRLNFVNRRNFIPRN